MHDHVLNSVALEKNQYLTVELAIVIGENQENTADLINQITIQRDSTPFPIPTNHNKAILFQGAVSFASLLEIYQQKEMATQNQMSVKQRITGVSSKEEFVMMRGPNGKGQCQVAVSNGSGYIVNNTNSSSDSRVGILHGSNELNLHKSSVLDENQLSSESLHGKEKSPVQFESKTNSAVITDICGTESNVNETRNVKQPNAKPTNRNQKSTESPERIFSFFSGIRHAFSGESTDLSKKIVPEQLICSLTYVNVTWQAVANELLNFDFKLVNK